MHIIKIATIPELVQRAADEAVKHPYKAAALATTVTTLATWKYLDLMGGVREIKRHYKGQFNYARQKLHQWSAEKPAAVADAAAAPAHIHEAAMAAE